jgi:hypothetical protein
MLKKKPPTSKKKSPAQLDREVAEHLRSRAQAAQRRLASVQAPLRVTYRDPAQIERDIAAAALPEVPQSGYRTGQIEARGLVASEVTTSQPTDEELLEYIEDLIKDPDSDPDLVIGTHGAIPLSKVIGSEVWTHGNLWREKRTLTPAARKWFSDYAKGFVAELRKIRDEIAPRLPS